MTRPPLRPEELFDAALALRERAEKAEVEAEFWKSKAQEAEESESNLEAEVEKLKEERNRIGVEIRGEYLPKLKTLEANLRRAVDIADVLRSGGSRACRELHHSKRDQHEYAEVCPVEERLEKAESELDQLKATFNQEKK